MLLLLQLRLLLLPPAADIFGLLDGGVGCLILMLELQVWHQAGHVFSLLFHIDGLYIKFGDAGTAGVARCEQCNCKVICSIMLTLISQYQYVHQQLLGALMAQLYP